MRGPEPSEPIADAGRGGIQVVRRAAQILRALDGEPAGLSLSAIAERTALPRSTVHRIVGALEEEGFVTAASGRGGIRLGPDLIRLARSGRPDLEAQLRPVLAALNEQLDETVDLAVLDGDRLRFVAQVAAPHRLRAVSAVGTTFPLHCTANGKAVLALLPDEAVDALLPAALERFTAHTIVTRTALLDELAVVRDEGVAFDREEHTEGIWAAGFAVRDALGTPVAISVPIPASRLAERRPQIVAALLTARADAVRRLAAGGPD